MRTDVTISTETAVCVNLQLINYLTSRRTNEDLRSQLVGQTFDIVFVQVGSWFVKRKNTAV